MGQFFGFLRGINVGGRNRLAMKRLVALFEEAGAREVSTYIQSGNVIWHAESLSEATKIAAVVEEGLAKAEGIRSPVVVRTPTQLRKALKTHPFLEDEKDERMLNIGFFSERPKLNLVKLLQPDRSPPDRYCVSGAEVYLHTPGGMARTKLTTDYFDRQLQVVTTMRNVKTVRALIALIN